MNEYVTVWTIAQGLADMKTEFDNETIILSGKTLRSSI